MPAGSPVYSGQAGPMNTTQFYPQGVPYGAYPGVPAYGQGGMPYAAGAPSYYPQMTGYNPAAGMMPR
jgi:hypothetical protein